MQNQPLAEQLQQRDLYIDYLLAKLSGDSSVLSFDDWRDRATQSKKPSAD